MYYVLVDSEGNRVDAFQEEQAAHEALRAMVDEEPDAADDVLLLAYRDDGGREGEALMFSDLSSPRDPIPAPVLTLGGHQASALGIVDLGEVTLSVPPTATVMASHTVLDRPNTVRGGAVWGAKVVPSADPAPTPSLP